MSRRECGRNGTPYNGDPTYNTIEFQPANTWFTDPTPDDHVEFDFNNPLTTPNPLVQGQTLFRDLTAAQQSAWFPESAPPSVLEVGFRGVAINANCPGSISMSSCAGASGVFSTNLVADDLLSTMLHEFGHELGINIEAGNYNIHPQHIQFISDVSVLKDSDSSHLGGEGNAPFLMCDGCGPGRTRRLPTATDVLTIAENGDIDDVRLDRVHFVGGSWNNPISWIGARVPDATMDAYVRNGPGSCGVSLFATDAVAKSIHLSSGCSFFTENRTLAASNGPSTITSLPGEPPSELTAFNNGQAILSDLILSGGQLNFSAGGTVVVNGAITINPNQGVIGRVYNSSGHGKLDVANGLVNNGLIRSQLGVLQFRRVLATPPVFDLDGVPNVSGVEPGEIDALHGDMHFDAIIADDFDGLMQVGAAHTVTFLQGWALGRNGALRLRGGNGAPASIEGSTSTIRGPVDVAGQGRLATLSAYFESSADVSVRNSNDRLQLNAFTIYRGGRFTGDGTVAQVGNARVEANTTIRTAVYDWDGDFANPSATTVLPDQTLTLDVQQINSSGNDYSGALQIYGGVVDVSTMDAWTLNPAGTLNLNNAQFITEEPGRGALVRGQPLFVSGSINARGKGNKLESEVHLQPTATVQVVGAESELFLNAATEYQGGSYTGAGTLIQSGPATVTVPLDTAFPPHTIIDVATFDWDGTTSAFTASTEVLPDATLFIRSQRIDQSGDGYDGTLTVTKGVVMVRLGTAPFQPWSLDGTMRLEDGAVVSGAANVLNPRQTGGSRLIINGRLETSGSAANDVYSAVTFDSTAAVSVASGATLNLYGNTTYVGGSYGGGGTIRQWGPATVMAPTAFVVSTFDLDGGNESTLWALNANLTLNVNQLDQGNNVIDGVIDANANATLSVNLPSGSAWEVKGILSVGATLPTTTLQMAGAPVKLNGSVLVKPTGTLVFHNDVSGSASFTQGGTVQFLGHYSPGNSPAIVQFDTDLELGPSAALKMEIAGLIPGSRHDQLVVTQDIVFDGTLEIDLLGAFAPRLGDQFILATYGRHSGAFAATDFPILSPPGTYWAIEYGRTALTATIATTIAGDLSLDGMVDQRDAALFATFLGLTSGSTWTTGDFNADGATTLADLAILQSHLGQTAPSPGAATAVPEPQTAVLAALAIVLPIAARRRGRSGIVHSIFDHEANA